MKPFEKKYFYTVTVETGSCLLYKILKNELKYKFP